MKDLEIPLERDGFMRRLIGQLGETLQSVVGQSEAAGFISLVGRLMGRDIDLAYRKALGVERFDRHQQGEVLVDLKRRIHGDFSVESNSPDAIVLTNRVCPFGEHVNGRPVLCMMTSNVFGTIVANHSGYARVNIEESIAMGHGGCRVTVHLDLPLADAPISGQEYFGDVQI